MRRGGIDCTAWCHIWRRSSSGSSEKRANVASERQLIIVVPSNLQARAINYSM